MGTHVILALGSNMGNRIGYLRRARSFCRQLRADHAPEASCSRIYESAPIGPADAPFLNAIIGIYTRLSPFSLLRKLKAFETAEGRRQDAPRWSNRPIDLDIIAYGSRIMHTPMLKIPHVAYAQRRFVLLPLQDISPEWRDPRTSLSLPELLSRAPQMQLHPTSLTW